MSLKPYVIKSLDDIFKDPRPKFGYEINDRNICIHVIVNGQKRPIQIALGSLSESLGLVVEYVPEAVEVDNSSKTWEKAKLCLRINRDVDAKLIQYMNEIFKRVYDAAKKDSKTHKWNPIIDKNKSIKAKVHPTQTLYSTDQTTWKHLGTGKVLDVTSSHSTKQTTPNTKKPIVVIDTCPLDDQSAKRVKQSKKRKIVDEIVADRSMIDSNFGEIDISDMNFNQLGAVII